MGTPFVQLKNRTININYIRSYHKAPDGSITVYLDQEGTPFIVPANEADVFLAVVEPTTPPDKPQVGPKAQAAK